MGYKIITSELEGSFQYIEHTDSDGNVFVIPMEDSNSDYQAYLAWKAEQEMA